MNAVLSPLSYLCRATKDHEQRKTMPSLRRISIVISIFLMVMCSLMMYTAFEIFKPRYDYLQLSWSPNGKYVAFVRQEDLAYEGMYAISVPDMNVVSLGSYDYIYPYPYSYTYPVWSPDSQVIAFAIGPSRSHLIIEIYRINADGSNPVNLTSGALQYAHNPDWSPDGMRIVFDGGKQIYIMDADGSNIAPLVDVGGDDGGPAWSPDGRSIAFHSWLGEENGSKIHIMDADGLNLTHIADVEGLLYDLIWSPDGSKIAFLYPDMVSQIEQPQGVFVLDVVYQTITQITGNGAQLPVVWSPDSTRIAYVTSEGLFVKNIQTNQINHISIDKVNNLFWKDLDRILSIDIPNLQILVFPIID